MKYIKAHPSRQLGGNERKGVGDATVHFLSSSGLVLVGDHRGKLESSYKTLVT